QEPGAGFEHLLPCPDRVVALSEHYLRDLPGEILDEEAAAALSLPESLTAEQEEERLRQQALHLERLRKEEEELEQQLELEQQQEQQQEGELGHDAADGGATRRRRTTAGLSLEGSPREGRNEQQVGREEGRHPTGREEQKRRGGEAGRRRGPALGGDGDGDLGALDVGVEEGSYQEGSRAAATVGGGDNSRGLGREELRRRRRRREEEEEEEEEESGGRDDIQVTGRRREQTGSEDGGGPCAVDGMGSARQREGGDAEERHGSRGLGGAELSGRVSVEGGEGTGGGRGRGGPFDLSVLCTAVNDVNHLLKATYPVDPRLADALLWDVDVSIWNVHSVEGAFRSDHRMPPAVDDFARGVPSSAERGGGGRTPPLTFLTLYGEHVEQWERWSEEAYEGWGWDADNQPHPHGSPSSDAEAATAEDQGPEEEGAQREEEAGYLDDMERGNSTFGALFRRPGVVYPIHPTGHLRLPRPKRPFAGQQQRRRRHLSGRREEGEEEEEEEAGGGGGE
ncbi:unnamed protein product, partial [Ectocarpus sp. 4 AP-2014]